MKFLSNILSVRKIDNHFICKICGIQIKIKYKTNITTPEVKDYGLTSQKRNTKIIASLTTFPERIETVSETISTLLTQTLKPDEVILWLAEEQFPDKILPEKLTNLQKFGLTIKWCEDLRSYKKLLPTLREYPNDIIITFDDDLYYAENTIETLYASYLQHSNEIHSHRCGKILLKKDKLADVSMSKLYTMDFTDSAFSTRQIGYGGVLYPPNCFYKDISDIETIKKLVPTHDDIWFWAMTVLNGTKIRSVKGYNESVNYVENTQDKGLCKINKKSGSGGSVIEAINKICVVYPEFEEILRNELKNV